MIILRVAAAVLPMALACATAQAAPAPQIFAPGIVSAGANDGSPTFSPDGKTLLFTRSGASWGVILESHRTATGWSQPRIASFSGRWNDWSPEFSPDGRFAVYVSIRPDTHANLWRVDRTARGWGTPVHLPASVNIGHSVWKPSITADGSIYFVSIDPQGHKRLYVSQDANGAYQTAQPLPFSDGTTGDVDPEVAPDGSFLVFASDGRLKGDAKDHLYAAFRENGAWQAPVPLRYQGDDAGGYSSDDEPHFSPDLKTLYFSSDRSIAASFPRTPAQAQRDVDRLDVWDNSNLNAWSVPLAPLLAAARADAGSASPPNAGDVEAQPTEDGIRAVEAHWTQAFVHGDSAYLDRLFAPNYESINAKGVVRDRATVIALALSIAKNPPATLPEQHLDVDLHGNAAIVTSSDGGQRSVDVFYYDGGAWHAWYSQHTAVATP